MIGILWGAASVVFLMWASRVRAGRDLQPPHEIDGARIHDQLTGPEGAPSIVMVHGFSTPGFIFDQNVVAQRDAGVRDLPFDHLGCGWSDRPGGRYEFDV